MLTGLLGLACKREPQFDPVPDSLEVKAEQRRLTKQYRPLLRERDFSEGDVERVAPDLARIARLAQVVPPPSTFEHFLGSLGWRIEPPFDHAASVQIDDLGFGLRHVARQYGPCEMTILGHGKFVIDLRANCSVAQYVWDRASALVLDAAGPSARAFGNGFIIHHEEPALQAAAKRERVAALGKPRPAQAMGWLADNVRLLTRYEPLTAGNACGMLGKPLPGGEAMKALIESERWDLVRNVLRGPNPGGRVMAAWALAGAERATPADWRAIRALRETRSPIRYCTGCVVHTVHPGTLLSSQRIGDGEVDSR